MMNEENKETVVPPVKVPTYTIKPNGGEPIELAPTDMAVMVVLDTTTGVTSTYNIQNAPLRAFARMLLNEGLNVYALSGHAHATVAVLKKALEEGAKDKKKGLELPFETPKA